MEVITKYSLISDTFDEDSEILLLVEDDSPVEQEVTIDSTIAAELNLISIIV